MLASDQQLLELLINDLQSSLSWYKEELDDEKKIRVGCFLVRVMRGEDSTSWNR